MDTYEFEKYSCSSDTLKATLEKYGVAIIPSIISPEECVKMRDGMWSSIEHITQKFAVPIMCDDVASWKSFSQLFALHSMLIQRFGLTHAQYYWDLRQNEAIVDVFANLWGVTREELLVSFDGLSLHLAPELVKKGWHHKSTYHCDQSFTRNEFECAQSFLSANEIRDGDATLAFLEGSHLLHKEVAEKFALTDKTDWHKLSNEEQCYYINAGCAEKRIKCPAGSLVLWSSSTIHFGSEPLKGRPLANERSIIYLCYTPRSRATKANLKKKVSAFENLRTTSHWPHKPKLFSVAPRTYGAPLQTFTDMDKPVLNELGAKLAGY